jgi:hypothetical protein
MMMSSPPTVIMPTSVPSVRERLTRILLSFSYLIAMRKTAFEPCIPTRGTKVPTGPGLSGFTKSNMRDIVWIKLQRSSDESI